MLDRPARTAATASSTARGERVLGREAVVDARARARRRTARADGRAGRGVSRSPTTQPPPWKNTSSGSRPGVGRGRVEPRAQRAGRRRRRSRSRTAPTAIGVPAATFELSRMPARCSSTGAPCGRAVSASLEGEDHREVRVELHAVGVAARPGDAARGRGGQRVHRAREPVLRGDEQVGARGSHAPKRRCALRRRRGSPPVGNCARAVDLGHRHGRARIVAECGGLENRWMETSRGFESLALRPRGAERRPRRRGGIREESCRRRAAPGSSPRNDGSLALRSPAKPSGEGADGFGRNPPRRRRL